MDEFVRSGFPFNYDQDAVSELEGLFCEDPSLAQQHMRDESDINTIVKRFGLSGQLPVGVRMPTYDDFTGVTNFHEAMNAVAQAAEAFDRMPADVRARFHNSPGEFVDFTSDVANREEAIKLGLVLPQAAELAAVPAAVPVAAPVIPQGVVVAKPVDQ